MIEIILESYFNLFCIIGVIALGFFLFGFTLIYRKYFKKKPQVCSMHAKHYTHTPDKKTPLFIEEEPDIFDHQAVTSTDLSAIAGDDIFATQLDLARAYIETGSKQLAKNILEEVMQKGNLALQLEARKLCALF